MNKQDYSPPGSGLNISSSVPDFSREAFHRFWDPGRKLLKSIRDYQRLTGKKGLIYTLLKKYCVLRHRFWTVVTGADIPLNVKIAGGLLLPHPSGIVIHPESEIGPNCLIFQQVTISGAVKCGGHVDIGAGAKILGPLTIGDHARIGANAVVTKDILPNSTVTGIPARPLNS